MNHNQKDVPLPIADVGFSGAVRNKVRWDENITWFDLQRFDKLLVTLRFFGPLAAYHLHWFKTKNGKKFPSLCSAYDPSTQTFVSGRCPYEDDFVVPQIIMDAKKANPLFDEENDPVLKEIKLLKSRMTGYGHVIVRNSNYADGNPWLPIKIPTSVVFSLIRLKTLNRVTIQGKTYEADIADPYWGRDIHIMYNSAERNPTNKYMINMGDHTPLTDVERSYLPQLYAWKDIVEFPPYEEVKQQLTVNGYYQMLNQLRGVASFDQPKQQYAYMEQYLPNVPKSPYGDVPMNQQAMQSVPHMPQAMPYSQNSQAMPQMMQQQQQMSMQMRQSQPQVSQQMPIPQNTMPQAPMPSMASNFGAGNLQPADIPVASPIPFNVPPPQGMEALESDGGEDFDIPFEDGGVVEQQQMPTPPVVSVKHSNSNSNGNGKTFSVRGKPNGVSASEYQQILNDFGNTLSRAKPFKTVDDPNLEGISVLNCYGNYCGDLNCVKCPLRQYCLHV